MRNKACGSIRPELKSHKTEFRQDKERRKRYKKGEITEHRRGFTQRLTQEGCMHGNFFKEGDRQT